MAFILYIQQFLYKSYRFLHYISNHLSYYSDILIGIIFQGVTHETL